jgi:hypothetical protein
MTYIKIFKRYLVCLISRLECQLEKTDFTKSRIRWTTGTYEWPTKYRDCSLWMRGEAEGCDTQINIDGHTGSWNWTIRTKRESYNLIVGHRHFSTLRGVKKCAAKFAVVQLLRKIDPDILGKKQYDFNTFCGFQPIKGKHM